MRYRKVDENGDMLPITSDSDFAEGSEAVALAVQSRIRLLYGEWWENEEAGFEVPSFLYDGNRMALGTDTLAAYVRSYIAETDGVSNVTVTATQVGRDLTLSCTIDTEYGTESEDITDDELLRAVY